MTEHVEYKRRNDDSFFGQLKSLWPIICLLGAAYASWQVLEVKVGTNSTTITDTVGRVNAIERKIDVHGQMLADIRDAVKDISRRQRRGD